MAEIHFHQFRPHPWHGLEAGDDVPNGIFAYIELTPYDRVKYEVDKNTGYLMVDRPQRSSSQPPALYGFIPRTLCGRRVGDLSPSATRGDNDPLDICVISERPINRGEVILRTRPIGGIQMVDRGEADDKIIAVLTKDGFWGEACSLRDIPGTLVDRLQHYFSTYKLIDDDPSQITIDSIYDADHAKRVIEASILDYEEEHGTPGR